MSNEISYVLDDDGLGFHARHHDISIGMITFVRVGIDKLVIDHTEIHTDYADQNIDAELVKCVVNLARDQHRKIMCMCPIARAVFNRTPEYDDIRLIHMH